MDRTSYLLSDEHIPARSRNRFPKLLGADGQPVNRVVLYEDLVYGRIADYERLIQEITALPQIGHRTYFVLVNPYGPELMELTFVAREYLRSAMKRGAANNTSRPAKTSRGVTSQG